MKVKAASGVRSLETALAVYQARRGSHSLTTATAVILDAWKAQLAPGDI